jgi:hypothetical protein
MTIQEKQAAIAAKQAELNRLSTELQNLEAMPVVPEMVWQVPTDDRKEHWKVNIHTQTVVNYFGHAPKEIESGQFFNTETQARQFALQCEADAAIAAAIEREHCANGLVVDWSSFTQRKKYLQWNHLSDVINQDWTSIYQDQPIQFYYVGQKNMVEMLRDQGITDQQMKHHCGVFVSSN